MNVVEAAFFFFVEKKKDYIVPNKCEKSKEKVMFKINEYVIYNSMGVYKIVDVRKEKDITGNETEYYILKPAYGNNLIIKTPVNNPRNNMRKTLSKEGVLSLIESMPNKETYWISNDRQRTESFKAALRTGDSEQWIKLIKSIYLEQHKKTGQGKKLARTDEDIMKAAEKNLYEEFAVALDIEPNEVVSFIMEHVS